MRVVSRGFVPSPMVSDRFGDDDLCGEEGFRGNIPMGFLGVHPIRRRVSRAQEKFVRSVMCHRC